jgi:uncharacterized protein YoxC
MIAELHALRHAQFAEHQAEHQELSRFEHRVVEGCQSLCNLVHSMADNSSEVRQGHVNLIAKVTELAQSINTDHEAFLHHQGQTGATTEKLNKVVMAVKEIEQCLNNSRTKVEDRFTRIETTCTSTAKEVTEQFMAKCREYFDLLAKLKKEQEAQKLRLRDLEASTQTGPAALSLVNALQKRVRTMAAQIFAL